MSPFGGGGKPKLKITSWNKQLDKYKIETTKATQGRGETRKLQFKLQQSYFKLEQQEVAFKAMSEGTATVTKESSDGMATKRVWVLTFQTGRNDVSASGVQQLRDEITAVIANADSARDEVVLRLDSPGGTVTGYGLAGAQLLRFRDAGLKFTIVIDQVAASGGYLMACTADRILCSPFAIIGSIGVVQELPIVFERLQKEGITFETTTAGKFKRTLTPFKKPTDEDRAKNKENIEDILNIFKNFVKSSRPSVDIDDVATGDTWLGPRAKDKGLVDDLMTSDALLLSFVKDGCQVFEVGLSKDSGSPLANVFASFASSAASSVAAAISGGAGSPGIPGAAAAASAWGREPGFAPSAQPLVRETSPPPMARYDGAWDTML
mmetsp:Transcript_99909/g.263931  ORF Transcript_99909/g.263931 Transcript_99909/m.263931 type:complete len:379 (+) Transcript_99909:3-1139(+)